MEVDGKSLDGKDTLKSVKVLKLVSKLLHLAGIAVLGQFMSSTYLEHELTWGLVQEAMHSFSFNFKSGIFAFPLESLEPSLHQLKEGKQAQGDLKRRKGQLLARSALFQVPLHRVKAGSTSQEAFSNLQQWVLRI